MPAYRTSERVERARGLQQTSGYDNARMPSHRDPEAVRARRRGRTLEIAVRRMGLSARPYDRVLKVARTIAGFNGAERVSAKHVAEGVQYRSLDRNYWNWDVPTS